MTSESNHLEKELLDQLRRLSPATLLDAMDDAVSVMTGVEAVHSDCDLVGTARTVRLDPDGLVAPIRTLDSARTGDILVIDTGGNVSEAVWGELLSTYAERTGVVGMVTNGAVRDVNRIRDRSYPVFAQVHTPQGPSGAEEDEANVTVTVGGTKVEPGDVLVGDEDGVVVVRRDALNDVIEAAKQVEANEDTVRQRIEQGDGVDRTFEPLR